MVLCIALDDVDKSGGLKLCHRGGKALHPVGGAGMVRQCRAFALPLVHRLADGWVFVDGIRGRPEPEEPIAWGLQGRLQAAGWDFVV